MQESQPPMNPETTESSAVRVDVVKVMNLLGLANRARRLILGSGAVLDSIRSGSAKLVFVATDTGQNALKKFRDKCAFYHIPRIEALNQEQLGRACGRSHLAVIAVTDPGFAVKLSECVGEFIGGEAFDETSGV